MRQGKASRAMEHLDDRLILSAMEDSDLHETAAPLRGTKGKGRKHMIALNHKLEKWAAVAAVFVILVAIGLFAGTAMVGASDTVIALDVNPSIELEINKKEEIKEIRALNEEAVTVLGEMDLKGVDLDVAINAIIGSMLKNGYLSTEQNSILISIDSGDAKRSTALKEKLTGEIDSLLGASNIQASVITQDFDRKGDESKKAEQNHISTAKAALISRIVAAELLDANGVPYTYEVLAQLKVNELKLILESKSVNVGGIEASGTASGSRYITREQALAIALEKAGLAEADVLRSEIEMDFEDDYRAGGASGAGGAMVYEVELRTATHKHEYELLATDGTILEQEVKELGGKGDKDDAVEETFAPTDEHIDRNAALEIAYKDAGVTQSEVRRPEIELDREGGRYVYEIEFKTASKEYEYTVNATTGEILEREAEPLERDD